ncbi:threonylcarbamoyl-AMP synthase [Erysipelothrix larvae]|uniref:L-threonylcarbamoyladenylate synthase n=1 Tax=Erysipelothrix larvae TaxID=1514105 RepID=A0A0X8H209_9FIRM|nr:L-threonylcarbamoyladenylate synthase [Erysipelothrix larvae]AMC94489.1 threonylcarbamoyl-AMP synthase [Erysipelothrix larvae]
METKRLTRNEVKEIGHIIKKGGVVAIPTDTVYGLAIHSFDKAVYEHLIQVKGRPDTKPFPLMVSSFEQIKNLVVLDALTEHLVKAWMPGAVTFIFNKKPDVFEFLGEQTTLGIRMADDSWVKTVIDAVGGPIWLPSANKSGEPTGTNSEMVLDQLDGLIEGVVEGRVHGGKSSSVFDLTNLPEIKELRAGPISRDRLEKTVKDYLESH